MLLLDAPAQSDEIRIVVMHSVVTSMLIRRVSIHVTLQQASTTREGAQGNEHYAYTLLFDAGSPFRPDIWCILVLCALMSMFACKAEVCNGHGSRCVRYSTI